MGWTDHEEDDASRHMVAGRARVFDRPIALAGFMGVGKSTLGKLLAEALDRNFFDTDREIERRTGRTPNDFFAKSEEADALGTKRGLSRYDIFLEEDGRLTVLRKGGKGEPNETNVRIRKGGP